MTDKEKKENLEELKDRKIEEEMLEDVAGGSVSGPIDIIGDDLSNPVAKKKKGQLIKSYQSIIKR